MIDAILASYRALLRLLPPAFRRRFGDEMAEGFAGGLRSRRGIVARLRFVAAALVDLPRAIGLEWGRLIVGPVRSVRPARPLRTWLRSVGPDLWWAVRSLRRQPGFVAAVVVTLALGIGANLAIFRLVDAVLLHPLPIPAADRVVAVFNRRADAPERSWYGLDGGLSYSTFRTLQQRSRSFAALAGGIDVEVAAGDAPDVRQVTVGAVSGAYFDVLGLQPAAGRFLSASDDHPGGGEAVAVLSDALWSRDHARDPAVVGRTIRLGGRAFVVGGVAPPGFRGTRLSSQPELWVPLTTITSLRAGGIWNGPLGARMLGDHPLGWVATIGRLADDATIAAATEELRTLAQSPRTAPAAAGAGSRLSTDEPALTLRPIVQAATLGDRQSLVRFVTILSVVVGLTLGIACMNVTNLLVVRATRQARDLAVRAALGAGRMRLTSQLFAEHLLLAALGALAALGVAAAAMRLLSAFTLPGGIAIAHAGLGIDGRTAGVAVLLAVVAALGIGLGPALRASAPAARTGLRAHGTGRRRAPRAAFIVGQVALSLVLLVGAALFVRSLRAGLDADLGFDPSPLSAVSVDLFRYGYDAARARAFYDDAVRRAAALPGVRGVALATHVPLSVIGTLAFDAPGGPYTPADPLQVGFASVSSDYFDVMRIPLVAGRRFSTTDVRGRPRVAMLNETAARALFAGAPPIGREIRIFGTRPYTVVGVVRDSSVEAVRDADRPLMYQHLAQDLPTGGVSLVARSDRPEVTLAGLREVIASVDPSVALYDRRLVADQVDGALMTQRFGSLLLGLFAVVALVVAAVGIYSVVAFTVSARTLEFGIRIALGAGPVDVLRVVIREHGAAVALGAVIGLVASLGSARALDRFLFEVSPLDPASFAGAGLLLAATAIGALLLPARRAVRTDPLVATRQE